MKPHRCCALLLATLVGASLDAFAETPPPPLPFNAITWKATMKRKPSTGLLMGTVHVRFEETTLEDIRRAASVGKIARRGDAAASEYWLCYTNVSPKRVERLWVIAHGEMGGPKHFVTRVSAELLPNGSATADCPALPSHLKPLSLGGKLWLGTPEKKLGAPSYQKGAWRSYSFEGKAPGNCGGGGFDVLSWLLLRFKDGHVHSLHAGQVTSC